VRQPLDRDPEGPSDAGDTPAYCRRDAGGVYWVAEADGSVA
jgi:hypothetical protein